MIDPFFTFMSGSVHCMTYDAYDIYVVTFLLLFLSEWFSLCCQIFVRAK